MHTHKLCLATNLNSLAPSSFNPMDFLNKVYFSIKGEDNCEGVVCMNGGSCVDLEDRYLCECGEGFYGQHCENEIPSDIQPSATESDCQVSTVTEVSTEVTTQTEVSTVIEVSTQIAVSTVFQVSTQTDISTVIEVSTVLEISTQIEVSTVVSEVVASCSAIEEEEEVNHCAGPPCGNGGTCFNLTDGYLCQCAEGWTGTDCETGTLYKIYLCTRL